LEDQGVDGRMESEWILGRLAGGVYSESIWLRIGTGGGTLVNAVINLWVLAPRSYLVS
jgi:hypothetical protein